MIEAVPEKKATAAFDLLYKEYYGPLVTYGHQLINNEQQAEEIATDVFIKLLRKKDDLNHPKDIKLFLYVTMRNACYDYLRYQQSAETTNQEIFDFVMSATDMPRTAEDVNKAQLLQAIFEEIEHLPQQCRQVFKHLFFNGMSTDQIMGAMKISRQVVQEQKNKALTLLRLALLKPDLPFYHL